MTAASSQIAAAAYLSETSLHASIAPKGDGKSKSRRRSKRQVRGEQQEARGEEWWRDKPLKPRSVNLRPRGLGRTMAQAVRDGKVSEDSLRRRKATAERGRGGTGGGGSSGSSSGNSSSWRWDSRGQGEAGEDGVGRW